MTQQNAALVEETNAAIEQTGTQANELDGIVEFFVTADETQRSNAVHELQRRAAAVAPRPAVRAVGGGTTSRDWSEF